MRFDLFSYAMKARAAAMAKKPAHYSDRDRAAMETPRVRAALAGDAEAYRAAVEAERARDAVPE